MLPGIVHTCGVPFCLFNENESCEGTDALFYCLLRPWYSGQSLIDSGCESRSFFAAIGISYGERDCAD